MRAALDNYFRIVDITSRSTEMTAQDQYARPHIERDPARR
jgi:hypothetical protein